MPSSDLHTSQGFSKLIELAAGESATVRFGAGTWSYGGVSFAVFPADGGEVKVERTLHPTSDDYWIEDAESPADKPTEGNDVNRFERIRFSAVDAAADIIILSSSRSLEVDG